MGMSQRIAKGALLRMDAAELIAFVNVVTLAEISSWSAQDLVDIGWMDSISSRTSLFGLYELTSAGQWILVKDASGRLTEANSSAIYTSTNYIPIAVVNDTHLSRLRDHIGNLVRSSNYSLKRAAIDVTLAAGGTLAATQLVAAVVGKSIYPEEVDLTLIPVTANIANVGGHAACITIQDDAGVPVVCGKGAVTHVQHHLKMTMLGMTTAAQDLDIVVEVGLGANHVGASRLVGHVLYREI